MKARKRCDLWLLFCLSLGVRLLVAACISRPGYMDVAYYAAGAVRVAQGGGLSEPFLWNYLDDPVGLPHPGFLYWMPLPSMLASVPAFLFPGSFFALQLPFVFLSALLPLIAYSLAWVTSGQRRPAWMAALITLFSGYFFPYWTLPETFAPFALIGSLTLWLAVRWRPSAWHCLVLGALAGLAHLTRADGILLLPVVALASLVTSLSLNRHHLSSNDHHAQCRIHSTLSLTIFRTSFVFLGYLIVMAPWFLRNLLTIGVPLSPGGTKTLWLRTYDDLFCYGCDLSPRAYLAWGWWNIIRSKLEAAGINATRFLAENCLVFLLPPVLLGLYRRRRCPLFILSFVYLFLIFLTHSLVFTFPGPRGGFFHASAPVLPFIFAAGAEGLEVAVGWVARRRRWKLGQALVVFSTAAVLAAVALSGYVAAQKLPSWRDADAAYLEIDAWLEHQGVEAVIVMVSNPPAFWYHTGRSAVVVPNAGVETLIEVADRYGVGYVVMDRNRPEALSELYRGVETAGLTLMTAFDGGKVQLYRRAQVGPQ